MTDARMEDEEKIGNNQEVMNAEHELKHDKEASVQEMINVYIQDKKEKEDEEKKKMEEAGDEAIIEEDKYMKKPTDN